MIKSLLTIPLLLSYMTLPLQAQTGPAGKPSMVFLLGDYQSCECDWKISGTDVTFVKACVPDFTSQQLSWTINALIINPLQNKEPSAPALCLLNTGQLDIALGVPASRIIRNIDMIRTELVSHDISLTVMAALDFTNGSQFSTALADLNSCIRAYCDSTGTGFFDPNQILSENGELKPGYVYEGFLINPAGCEQWNALINEYLSKYGTEE